MTSKSDASKEKVFWHEGNFGEWIAFMENYVNLCVASKCSFMVHKIPIEKHLNQDIDMCIPDLRTRIMNLATNRYYSLYPVLINLMINSKGSLSMISSGFNPKYSSLYLSMRYSTVSDIHRRHSIYFVLRRALHRARLT